MTFFARPRLSDDQFVQHSGDTLTLRGETRIASTTGLTLIGDSGYIPIQATGGSNNFVLTYDDSGSSPVIKLKESTSSGGTTVYPYSAATTCTVGGLNSGSDIYNCEVVDILHNILVPTLNPTLTNPSISSFTLNPSTTMYEVGTISYVTGTTLFNPGSINPVYPPTACSCRSDGTGCYIYNAFGIPYCCIINAPSNVYSFGSNNITSGSNIISTTICYSGGTQPYDSAGNPFSTPLSTGVTATCQKIICGVYPWYFGIVASGGVAAGVNRPSTCCIKDMITGGTYSCKCVGVSTGTLETIFNSTSDDYLWFATPNASTTKSCWYVDALNKGCIGGVVSAGGNLFPTTTSITGVTTTCWSNQTYKIYVSNYQTCSTSIMQLRNS